MTGEDDMCAKRSSVVQAVLTGVCAIVLTVLAWVVLVAVLDRPLRAYGNLVWAGTLWVSAIVCSSAMAYSRRFERPVLACTVAFGIFGLAYMACEGPFFGNVSQGGDPSVTRSVVWNLVCLPLGVFAATEIASRLAHRRGRLSET